MLLFSEYFKKVYKVLPIYTLKMGLIRRYTLESVPYFAASVETLRGVLLMWEQGIGRYDIPAGDGLHWDGNKEVLLIGKVLIDIEKTLISGNISLLKTSVTNT